MTEAPSEETRRYSRSGFLKRTGAGAGALALSGGDLAHVGTPDTGLIAIGLLSRFHVRTRTPISTSVGNTTHVISANRALRPGLEAGALPARTAQRT